MIKFNPHRQGIKINIDKDFSRLGITSCFKSVGWWLRKIAVIDGPLSISGFNTINSIVDTMAISPINYEIYECKQFKHEIAIVPWVAYMTPFMTRIDKAITMVSLKEYQQTARRYDIENDFEKAWDLTHLPWFTEHCSIALIHHYACRDVCPLEAPILPREYRDALKTKCYN